MTTHVIIRLIKRWRNNTKRRPTKETYHRKLQAYFHKKMFICIHNKIFVNEAISVGDYHPFHNLFCHTKRNNNTVQGWTTTKCPHMTWWKTKPSMTSYSTDMSSTLWTKRWDITDLYVWHDELYGWRELCMRVTRDRTNSFVWDTDMSSQHTSMYA